MIDLAQLGKDIADHRLSNVCLNVPHVVDNFEPYDLQMQVASRLPKSGAWKAGGTNKKTQTYFNTKVPYYGPIEKDKVFLGSELKINTASLAKPLKGELEICFMIEPEHFLLSHSDLKEMVRCDIIKTLIGLEMPWTIYQQPQAGLDFLIADVCGANSLLCGQPFNFSLVKDSIDVELTLECEGEVVTAGNISDSIIQPLDVLIDFFKFVEKRRIEIDSKIILATGGITACVPVSIGKEYSVKVARENNFRFTLI